MTWLPADESDPKAKWRGRSLRCHAGSAYDFRVRVRQGGNGPIPTVRRHGRSGGMCFPSTSSRWSSPRKSLQCTTREADSGVWRPLQILPRQTTARRRIMHSDPLQTSIGASSRVPNSDRNRLVLSLHPSSLGKGLSPWSMADGALLALLSPRSRRCRVCGSPVPREVGRRSQ